jgi:hypothetical protein
MHWYDKLRTIESRGSQAERPGSLAGLAAARQVHLGQFFTPDNVAALMWRIVQPAIDKATRKVSLFDNSAGSGRLLQFADPAKHALYGVDIDGSAIHLLAEAAQAAGFDCEFEACGMDAIHPANVDVALINPPFSLHIESPLLKPYPCTCYGKFGPNTSTLSHAYALAQAVAGSQLVVALLPSTFAEEVASSPETFIDNDNAARLRAHIELPPGLFRVEGTDVRVSLLVFGGKPAGVGRYSLKNLSDPLPGLGLHLSERSATRMRLLGVTDDEPAITRPVTGDTTVRVGHNSRKVILGFNCGLTEAKVLNGIYINRVADDGEVEFRRPKGFKYAGQGALDMEVHLMQDDPIASFEELIAQIRRVGGAPVVDPGTWSYLRRRIRQSLRQKTPLRHTVLVPDGVAGDNNVITGYTSKCRVADPKVWGSPLIKAKQEITFHRQEAGHYTYEISGRQFNISAEELYKDFTVNAGAAEAGWTVIHPGLNETFPKLAHSLDLRAKALGIDRWLTWGFQWEDLLETALKPTGCIIAWEMGLGKARLASALLKLIGTKHGLIVVEGGLVDEMIIELSGLPIPATDWQVIRNVEQLSDLRQINVISYERLRMPIDRSRPRDTYAARLRRRIGVLVADEGDVLSNPESDQSRALYKVSPRRRYVLSATPLASYPRDVLPIMVYTGGDCTAAQPWGWRRGYLEQNWRKSVSYARRGLDAFRETYITMQWVTREFEDSLLEGAKREIPSIRNIEKYRAMVAPSYQAKTTSGAGGCGPHKHSAGDQRGYRSAVGRRAPLVLSEGLGRVRQLVYETAGR